MTSYGWIDAASISAPEILALYDAVHFGMLEYILRHEVCRLLVEDVPPWDSVALYHVLASAGIFDDPLAFNRFSLDVERGLWQGPLLADQDALISQAEKILSQLGVARFGTEPAQARDENDSLANSSWKEGDVYL